LGDQKLSGGRAQKRAGQRRRRGRGAGQGRQVLAEGKWERRKSGSVKKVQNRGLAVKEISLQAAVIRSGNRRGHVYKIGAMRHAAGGGGKIQTRKAAKKMGWEAPHRNRLSDRPTTSNADSADISSRLPKLIEIDGQSSK